MRNPGYGPEFRKWQQQRALRSAGVVIGGLILLALLLWGLSGLDVF